MYAYTHTRIYLYMYIYIHTCTYIYIYIDIYTYIYTYIPTLIRVFKLSIEAIFFSHFSCRTHAVIYECVHVYVYVYVYVYFIYVYIAMYMYVCIFAVYKTFIFQREHARASLVESCHTPERLLAHT